MISWLDVYHVFSATVPLYVAMILGYLSAKHLNIFSLEQSAGINKFVAKFSIPLLSFQVISQNNPFKMSPRLILSDILQKILAFVVLAVVLRFWHPTGGRGGKLGWIITGLSVSVLPNTLILGIPILSAIDGDAAVNILVQIVVLQSLIWYNILLFLFEINAARKITSSGASIEHRGNDNEEADIEQEPKEEVAIVRTRSPGTGKILLKAWQKLIINPNTYATLFGLTITTSGTNKGDLFVGDVATQVKNKNFTADIKVASDSSILTTFTYDEATPGLKAIVSAKVPDQKSAKVELQYLHPHAGICTSVGLTANPVVNFSGVIGTSVLALGTDVSFHTESSNFKHFNAGVSFTKDDLIASLTLNDKGEKLNASYYHIVNPLKNTVVGAEVSHNLKSQVNSITVGTQHALDPLTTVKARVNNAGIANALIQHEWRPKSFITISGEVDSKAIEKSAKVGFALALKP
ncbi:hypothetical protein F2Q68_00022744 [Brassica cretica]|uniref:Auxin efflux carrier component n=1 Tax=Brassica cretica TaxID=69181 RepID=A0A8S9FU14_BRACR|nr:hypothetical protein F2Q68_00022744 [Brassica cretica]